ncbi:hypothetical protein ACHEUO_22300 [Klebsiella oxytoca]|uniref:hypothetical protein n=1 Tax=Klebsiella oxytoca TaxID=571 RepID=UPI003756DB7D|nr:hypothetical protein [Klebsiella oxytoca]
MNREEMLYQILYSHNLERMFSTVTGRIDKALSFFLILLGSGVIVGLGYPVITGLLIAGISAIKLAFHFEASSERSRKQAAAYLKLFNAQHLIESDDDLLNKITELQDEDHTLWSVLIYPAMVATQIEMGKTPTTQLTFTERLFARVSGAIVQARSV